MHTSARWLVAFRANGGAPSARNPWPTGDHLSQLLVAHGNARKGPFFGTPRETLIRDDLERMRWRPVNGDGDGNRGVSGHPWSAVSCIFPRVLDSGAGTRENAKRPGNYDTFASFHAIGHISRGNVGGSLDSRLFGEVIAANGIVAGPTASSFRLPDGDLRLRSSSSPGTKTIRIPQPAWV